MGGVLWTAVALEDGGDVTLPIIRHICHSHLPHHETASRFIHNSIIIRLFIIASQTAGRLTHFVFPGRTFLIIFIDTSARVQPPHLAVAASESILCCLAASLFPTRACI
jgi:hypothetical protein